MGDGVDGVRSMFEWIIITWEPSFFDFRDFLADENECLAIPVQFGLGFAFCWFDHHGSGNGP